MRPTVHRVDVMVAVHIQLTGNYRIVLITPQCYAFQDWRSIGTFFLAQ
jgi:hypothetical protein